MAPVRTVRIESPAVKKSPANVRKSGRARRPPSTQKDFVTENSGLKATPAKTLPAKSTPKPRTAAKKKSKTMSAPSAKRAKISSEVENDPLALNEAEVEVGVTVKEQEVNDEASSGSPEKAFIIYAQINELRFQDVAQRLPPPAPYHARLNDFVTRFFPTVKFEEKSEAAFQQELAKPKTEEIVWVDEPFRMIHYVFKRQIGTAKKEKIVEMTYMCSICRRTFSPRYKFFKHLLLHSKCFVVSCDICDEDFDDLNRLLSHRKKHTPDDSVKYMCDKCPESFCDTKALHCHREALHFPLKPTCRWCKKVFHLRDDLIEHMTTSHEENTFFCVVCNRDFASPYERVGHEFNCMKNLPGTTCDICDMRFSGFSDLRKHEEDVHEFIACGRLKYNFNMPRIKYTSP